MKFCVSKICEFSPHTNQKRKHYIVKLTKEEGKEKENEKQAQHIISCTVAHHSANQKIECVMNRRIYHPPLELHLK